MTPLAALLLTLGCLFFAGLATDLVGRRTRLPRVSLLLALGFVIGPSTLDLLPAMGAAWHDGVTVVALVMVGFLLGEKLSPKAIAQHQGLVLRVSVAVTLGTMAAVALGLWLLGWPPELALLLAGTATATDPAATADVVKESSASGPFSRALIGIVAIDDVWGIIAFSFLIALAHLVAGGGDAGSAIMHGMWHLVGGMVLGGSLGVAMAALTGRLRKGEPTQAEALGFVFLCAGLAVWLQVSYLIAAVTLGAVVASRARHHKYAFSEIEGIEWPFLILFFVLAGAALDARALWIAGPLSLAYATLRVGGRLLGGWLGAAWHGADPVVRRWMGVALLPQAGVAIGMALVAAQQFPQYAEVLLPAVLGATVLFELVGPLLTRVALQRTGEARQPD